MQAFASEAGWRSSGRAQRRARGRTRARAADLARLARAPLTAQCRRGAAGGVAEIGAGSTSPAASSGSASRAMRSASAAEWHADGVPPLGDASRLRSSTSRASAAHRRRGGRPRRHPSSRTAASARPRLSEHGVHAVLATPIVAQERLIGVLAFHRSIVGDWSPGEIALAEAVAREAALAIDTSRLLRESDAGCGAGGAPQGRRGADERSALRRRDPAARRGGPRSSAPTRPTAGRAPGGSELAAAPSSACRRRRSAARSRWTGRSARRSRRASRCSSASSPRRAAAPASSCAVFAEVMDAPISSFGEMRGVLGVCSREAGRFEEPTCG